MLQVLSLVVMTLIIIVLWVLFIVFESRQLALQRKEHYIYSQTTNYELPAHNGPALRLQRYADIYRGSYKPEAV